MPDAHRFEHIYHETRKTVSDSFRSRILLLWSLNNDDLWCIAMCKHAT